MKPSSIVAVLAEDPGLAESIPRAQRALATRECVAPVVLIARGRWGDLRSLSVDDGIGLLVLEGLLLRRVGIEGQFGAELLGEGDLLRPWQGEDVHPALAQTTGWRVLAQTRVAVLDRRVAHSFARYPQLTGRLVARALERSRNLAINMAIVHHARVDVRLRMLFWHLADRWGHVRPDGVTLALRLTHGVLADLVAARRPTVTSALSELGRQGLVDHRRDYWLLRGGPPGELLELQDVTVHDGGVARAALVEQ